MSVENQEEPESQPAEPPDALDDWLEGCRRCATNAGRTVRDIEVVQGDADFPSFDGAPPLKVAVFR